ncbi:MAG TPA: hypothetical protein VGL16_12635 [Actinomycetota bacterium]
MAIGEAGLPPGLLALWVISAVLGGLATWYGFLEAEDGHPLLKLGGAMLLAGGGVAALLMARPTWPRSHQDHAHSSVVLLHPTLLGAAWLSMAAALIHFAVIKQHLDEYQLYGLFFVAVAIAQLAWAVLAVTRPSKPLLVAGAVGNALVAGTWVLTRTYGSLIGPDATHPASAGFGDIVSTIFEAVLVIATVILLRSGLEQHHPVTPRTEVLNFVLGLGITLLTVLALYSAVAGTPFVSKVG